MSYRTKCHADTDFHAPSRRSCLLVFRRCIHKLTELATARRSGGGGGQHSVWIGLTLHIPASHSPAHWIWRSSSQSLLGEWCQRYWSSCFSTLQPSWILFVDSSCGRRHLLQAQFSPVIIFPPEWLGQLFWTLLLWICLVSETHRILTICIFTRWELCGSWHYLWNLTRSQSSSGSYDGGSECCKFCNSI